MSAMADQVRKLFKEGDDIRDAGLTTPEEIERFDDIVYGADPTWQSLDVYRRKDAEGKPFRCGGYGYLIDDGGSGYAIGRDILIAVAHAEDGRGPVTCLTQGVYEFLHVSSIGEVITWLYNPDTGKKQIAALAPLLLKALEQGDEAAKEIASHAANDLAGLVVAAWRKTGMRGGEVALSGSILKYYPVIRDDVLWRLREALPDTQFIEPRGSASFGAAKLAMTAL